MSTTSFSLSDEAYEIVDLKRVFGDDLIKLPHVLRILAENLLRNGSDNSETVRRVFLKWLETGTSESEIEFHPGRVLMHDTTCTPALVDIAGMRDAIAEAGGDPDILRPRIPVDVSVDHSVAVDRYGSSEAFASNMAIEMKRNAERYRLMKWASSTMPGFRVNPPGTGIMHTINLEQLATVITTERRGSKTFAVPDTLIGTDSHTPMINSIGVLGWGVGGLEAEGVMFGLPVTLRLPEVVGVHLTGALSDGVLSTDVALVVTKLLRDHGVTGEFVEFFGPGVVSLTAGDRGVVSNMAPEYGATTGFFPIDRQSVNYLIDTGRDAKHVQFVEAAAKQLHLWFDPQERPTFTRVVKLDLSKIEPSLAGPRRPQDQIEVSKAQSALENAIGRKLKSPADGEEIPDGAVAIAAITSCTNTSDPRLLIAAGLVARKARAFGLQPPSWVKTSLAPGSPAARRYLERADLLDDLKAVGFDIVGFGCTTCIGNSGPLPKSIENAISQGKANVAVLSGNRNFPGRVHPFLDLGFLASPPMVVAFALCGDMQRDIRRDAIAVSADGHEVLLSDLWPTGEEIDACLRLSADAADFSGAFDEAWNNKSWQNLDEPKTKLFPWDENSTYIRRPPFTFSGGETRLGKYEAAPLLVLGDDITTDHISPAGQIPKKSEAGQYLINEGENPIDLNVFAARRGNFETMVRGLFENRSVKNLLEKGLAPATTIHTPSNQIMTLREASQKYREDGQRFIIIAGERYGMGSSRDWAAKGVALLGVSAVLAASFERIHRTNLIAMGVLPLILPSNFAKDILPIAPGDRLEINADPELIEPRGSVKMQLKRATGEVREFDVIAAVETVMEIDQLVAGGVIPLILSQAKARHGGGRHNENNTFNCVQHPKST
ncbi:aconitate hydratase AcnA [Mesorhizobium sp. SB112]|uniref:aconitate hydratase AcnA n=1 Tax=Mesorhizobium sp. SB112 TaxID=3151853 RepID=UPI0032665996